ncbi:MAG TPA: hypothetical protein DEB25_00220 [Desulfobulbaceae bacterium]|nr:hypothetical protein [Desulfobulbaceae bacterium]
MVEFRFAGASDGITSGGLLDEGEVIAVVEEAPEIVPILEHRLSFPGFPVRGCHGAGEMFALFDREKIALVLLDINLSDQSGISLLETLAERDSDLGIVVITARADLQMALACIRAGADDYLIKPLSRELLGKVITTTLTKRRLVIENRRSQRALQRFADERQFLYRLGRAMNDAYLTFHELSGILRTILVGITAKEGLGFNRAFLFLFEPDGSLRGRMAIGPASPEEAGKVWESIVAKGLSFDDILYHRYDDVDDPVLNEITRKMIIPATMDDHVAMVAGRERISIVISGGQGENGVSTHDLPAMLGCDHFLVTPLISPHGAIGVIIADNRFTGATISESDMRRLEMFASQASLAIERSRLHQEMLDKIAELEKVTRELARTRHLIVDMERYSTIGHMTAQLAHDIRNPLASIGAAASWLEKKCDDPYYQRFLKIIVKEVSRVESTLKSMSAFASDEGLSLARRALTPLVEEALLALRPELQAAAIVSVFIRSSDEIFVNVDAEKMREVFLLSIKNAILAMPEGGSLRVEVDHGDGQAVILFRHKDCPNNYTDYLRGCGDGKAMMPLQHPDNISAKKDIQGQTVEPFHDSLLYKLALSLAMARRIVSRHGGNIFLSLSEEGDAIARVVLPEA